MNIAITGRGIISALGPDIHSTLDALLNRRTGIAPLHRLRSVHTDLPVGEVDLTNAELKAGLGITDDKPVSRTALMGMWAVREALCEAGITQAMGRRVLFINGTTVGGMDITEDLYPTLTPDNATDILGQHDCGNCTRITAEHFPGLFADFTTLSTACSSAANAIMLGARLLREGLADMVVAGGSEALTRFHLNGFRSLMITDPEPCRPFCATRAGLNLGEGAAYIVMEPDEAARQRGAHIHAYLTGYGNACDAYHQTATSPDGHGATLAMTQALHEAGLQPQDIDYVNAHGTATPNNDLSESAALRRVFGQTMPDVSSTKGFTGHATSAAGGIEAVICLLAMERGFVPANIGWREPMPDGIKPCMGRDTARLRHVLCNSFGFGGNDTALVFSACPTTTSPVAHGSVPVVRRSQAEVNSVDALTAIRQYVKPLEARRMSKLMKAAYLTAMTALREAGIDKPDAIITATAYGCLDNSEQLLNALLAEGEMAAKPTLFMQSTHNTIGSDVAIRLGCHGYNATYTQGPDSLRWALLDAEMLLRSGQCRSVLVGCHDEMTPHFSQLTGGEGVGSIHSLSLLLTCGG